ncbi:MAG TPA: HAMP domain-containing protein, partial [Ktedonobacterales bacterium]|nr:HAMP domain-containing protein [Ktedonobacterales bacterium]
MSRLGGDGARPRSFRLRLALWYGVLLAAALLVFGALVTVLTTNAILGSVDTALGAEARIATLDLDRELSPMPPYWPSTLNLNVVDAYRDPGVTVAIYDEQGRVRYRSARGATLPIDTNSPAFTAALAGRTSVLTSRASGEPVRVVVVPVIAPATSAPTPGGTPTPVSSASSAGVPSPTPQVGGRPVIGVLLVAKSLRDVDATLLLLRTVLILTGLAILAAALLGGWIIARRVLRPLALIGATARRIAAGTSRGSTVGPLRHRVPRPAGEDELAHLVDTLNQMLAAIEHATSAQRRFVADASHELRAPL